ncbi:MAG: hypothetical protein ACOYIE_07250, partial [Agathobaculum sp.]|uniref:hypothetical protein n=1 Tax=Agathobaculum sp. TaxID=2048138 RepID=UPI003D8F677F
SKGIRSVDSLEIASVENNKSEPIPYLENGFGLSLFGPPTDDKSERWECHCCIRVSAHKGKYYPYGQYVACSGMASNYGFGPCPAPRDTGIF